LNTVANDLIEKARKIKSEINTFKGQLVKEQYSASDSEAIAASKAALTDASTSSFNQITRPSTQLQQQQQQQQKQRFSNYRQDSKSEKENFMIEENDEKLSNVEEKAHVDETKRSYESIHQDRNSYQPRHEKSQKESSKIEIKKDSNARNSINRRLSSNEGYRDREFTQPIGRSSTTAYNSDFNMIPVKSDQRDVQNNWTDDECLYNSTFKEKQQQQQPQKKLPSPLKEQAFNSIESINMSEQQTGSLTTFLDEAKKLSQTSSTPHLYNKENIKKIVSMPTHDEVTTQHQQHQQQQQHQHLNQQQQQPRGSSYSKLSSSQYLEGDSEELFLKSSKKQLAMGQMGPGNSTQSISGTGNRPEKLFSNRNLNQKILANMQMNLIKSASSVTNMNPPVYGSSNVPAPATQQAKQSNVGAAASKAATTAAATASTAISSYAESAAVVAAAATSASANSNEVDSDGSERSLISNRSKKSSIGAISQPGHNELIKGANTNANAKTSGLATSLDQYGTTNAANKMPSKQQLTSAGQLSSSLSTGLPALNTKNQTNVTNSITGGAYGGSKMITDPIQGFFPSNAPSVNNINNLNSIKPASQDTTTNAKSKANLQMNNSLSEKNDGTLSDSALSNPMTTMISETSNKKRRPSMAKALVILGLSKKSNSASNLAYGETNR
jgi:hypothetical protein